MNIILGQNINKSFNDGDINHHVLKNVNLEVTRGEFVSIMGPSGSGKSTLRFTISGMDKIDSGEILFSNNDISNLNENESADLRRKNMGFVFQQPTMLKNLNVLDNIILPSLQEDKDKKKLIEKAKGIMDSIGILELADREINKVSGGELQRAGICRALMNDPEVIFADEPTGALNTKSSEEVMEVLTKINEGGTTIVLVTHDAKVAAKTNRVLFMKYGMIVDDKDFYTNSYEEKLKFTVNKMLELGI